MFVRQPTGWMMQIYPMVEPFVAGVVSEDI
jgi:hypothetical protein